MVRLLWLCCCCCALLVGRAALARGDADARSDANPEAVTKLKNMLAEKRDPLVRPDIFTTNVTVSMGFKSVTLMEMHSTIIVSAWIKMEWVDKRIAWEGQEEFKSIKMLPQPSDLSWIWQPDIVLKNGLAGTAATLSDRSADLNVFPDGRITWTPSAQLEAYCELDLRRWPFEEHRCALLIGSWSLDRDQLRIIPGGCKLEFPGQMGEFIVDEVFCDLEVSTEVSESVSYVFEDIEVLFKMHREPGNYRALILTPAAVVVILCLATFLLPPRAGEKIVLGGVNAMLICFFLVYFAHSLPLLTDQTPFIVVFYTSSLYLVCLSLVAAVLVLNLSRQPHASRLPWPVKNFLTGPCGRALLLSGYIQQMMGVDSGPCSGRGRASSRRQEEVPVVMHEEMTETLTFGQSPAAADAASVSGEIGSSKVNPAQEWLLLAAAIDRALFLMYSLLFVCLAIAFHI